MGMPEFVILFGVGSVFALGFVFWAWMLVEAATKEAAESQDRLIWVLVVLLGAVLGAAVYFFFRRPQRKAALGR